MFGKSFALLSLGEVLLRMSPIGGERLVRGSDIQMQVGGAELNVAVGVSLLGLRTGIITKLPAHDMGKFAKNKVRSYGISDDCITYDDDKHARMGLYFHEHGAYPRKPKVIYDRKDSSFCNISADEFPNEMYDSANCFHSTGITLALCPQTRKTAIEMMTRFKQAGTLISFDVNYRANLWDEKEARACIEEILPLVDIFFCSEDTARLTFGKTGSCKEMMKSFTQDYPISFVASTQRLVHSPKSHTFGSVIYNAEKDQYYEEDSYHHIDVIDRIGSGDAYIAGVLYGLLSTNGDCAKAVAYGNAASALKNTVHGDLPSSDREEVDMVIREHNEKGRVSEMSR